MKKLTSFALVGMLLIGSSALWAQGQSDTRAWTDHDKLVVEALVKDDFAQCQHGDWQSLSCSVVMLKRNWEVPPVPRDVTSLTDLQGLSGVLLSVPKHALKPMGDGVYVNAHGVKVDLNDTRGLDTTKTHTMVCDVVGEMLDDCEMLSSYFSVMLDAKKKLLAKPLNAASPINLNSLQGRIAMSALFFAAIADEAWIQACKAGHCDFEALQARVPNIPKDKLDPVVLDISKYVNQVKP